MAWTERYVTTAAAGGGNGLAEGTAWTLDEAFASVAAGQRINVKAGVYNRTSGLDGSGGHGLFRVEAYTNTPGDGGEATIKGPTSGAGFALMMFGVGTSGQVAVIGITFQDNGGSGNAPVVNDQGSDAVIWSRCRFRGAAVRGACQIFNAVECEFSLVMGSGAGSEKVSLAVGGALNYTRCEFTGAGNGIRLTGSAKPNVIDCTFKVTGIGIWLQSTPPYARIAGCAFTGCTDGIKFENPAAILIENNNFVANTGFGINFIGAGLTGGSGYIRNNGFGTGNKINLSGATSTLPTGVDFTGNVNLPADTSPWVNSATGDFRNAIPQVKGTGRGTYVQAVGQSGTVGYPDIGIQSQYSTEVDPVTGQAIIDAITAIVPTAAATADKLLGRRHTGGADGGRTVSQALAAARNKVALDVPAPGQFTVYDVDDTTPLWVGTYTRGAGGLGPLITTDPA